MQTKSLTVGAAPFSVRLTIGDPASSSSRSRNQAQLFSSIDILKGTMLAAREQWEEMTHHFKESLNFSRVSLQEKSIAIPTINKSERQ